MNNSQTIDNCHENTSLVKPIFGQGMLLEPEDLNQIVDYSSDLNRMLFQALFGCGVVCGLNVSIESDSEKLWLVVSPGVAISGSGDPIQIPKTCKIVLDTMDGTESRWVVLRRKEKRCELKPVVCAFDQDTQRLSTRIKIGFEIVMYPELPTHVCSCHEGNEKCYEDHLQGKCSCDSNQDGVVLAKISHKKAEGESSKEKIIADPSVRRYVRPILAKDNATKFVFPNNDTQKIPDDLKQIPGIGEKVEKVLRVNGIVTFEQLAQSKPEELKKLFVFSTPKIETWPDVAKKKLDAERNSEGEEAG